tara:strand:+ start:1186 stop:2619 length:1434 start_codon:yes stop_codon:yes gene_type:complete
MANFNVDSSGNLWLGTNVSDTFSTAQSQAATKFYVTSAGSIFAIQGTIGGIDLASTHIQSSNYSSTSGSEAGFKINSNGNAEFNNVSIRGDLFGVELKGQMVFNGGDIKTSTTGTRVEILDNSGIEGEIRFETSTGTTARLVADAATEFTIEQSALSGGKIKLITGTTSDGLQFTGNEINITTPLSSGNPVIKLNGTNANSAGTSTLSKLLGVTSSGRLAVGSATSGVVSISGTGDIAVTGSSGVLNIHHDDSDHSYAASGHDHDSDYYSSSAGSFLASSLSSHTSQAHSLSLNSNVSNNDSGGLFVTAVSGLGITRTNIAGTTMDTQKVRPHVSESYALGESGKKYTIGYFQFGTSSSDERLKENIESLDLGLDFINKLEPKKYNWTTETITLDNGDEIIKREDIANMDMFGFLAQDVLAIDDLDDDTTYGIARHIVEEDSYEISNENFIAPLVKAVQELSTQISDLNARIEVLEG